MTRLFIAWIKKKLGIQSPSTLPLGYKYEYDYLRRTKMSDAICYCGSKMDIKKTSESHGMDGSYTNWTLRCPRCGIVKGYAADGFYGREYFSNVEDVINEWNRNKAACLQEDLCTKGNTKE